MVSTEKAHKKRLRVALIGGIIFFSMNILFPYMKILFGFLEYSDDDYKAKYFASGHKAGYDEGNQTSIGYDYFANVREGDVEWLYTLLDLWQWVFVLGGIAALTLVIIPEVVTKTGGELPELPVSVGLIGFIIGVIASGVEWLLFILVWMLEDWANQPNIGFFLLILNFIGFVALYIAAKPSLLIKE